MRDSKCDEVTIRHLSGSFHPIRKAGNIVGVGNKLESDRLRVSHPTQQHARLSNALPVGCGLSQNSYEAEFGYRTRRNDAGIFRSNPRSDPMVELVARSGQSDQSINVQQVGHGKSAKISSTSLLVSGGAPGGAARTGRPVIGSVTILARRACFLCGVSVMRPSSTPTSSESPGRRPRRRRIGPGRTTWPFVETLVCMVRRSYHGVVPVQIERLNPLLQREGHIHSA